MSTPRTAAASAATPGSAPGKGPAPASPPNRFIEALRDWASSEGLTWVYIFKTVFAALLALYLAMRLELPSPRSAMVTVFVVMQPQSGMVFAKSFYRLAGTLVGLVVTLALVACFAQARDVFLVAVALWISFCTAGAARNRNFRSYGFVLAGYTAALVGLPTVEHAVGAFDAGVTRALEVSLGALTAGAVSATLFPERASTLARLRVRQRFKDFVAFIHDAAAARIDRPAMEARNKAFIADVVGLEALRSYASFEDPETRARSARVARMNSEFMAASTRFHALHQLINRLRAQAGDRVTAIFTPFLHELGEALTRAGRPVESAAEAREIAQQLDAFRTALPARVRAARVDVEDDGADALLDYDTASELLYRFADELSAYAQTYASLDRTVHERGRTDIRYAPKTHMLSAGIAGARAAVVMLALSVFWIVSGWPAGNFAVLNAAAICAIVSSVPQPAKLARQMVLGGLLSVVGGYVAAFVVMPALDGFMQLAFGLLPFLLAGMWLATRPRWAGIGVGFCIFFTATVAPDNRAVYDVTEFLNNGIALEIALLAAWVSFTVLIPPSSTWLLRRMEASLRRQVRFACFGRRRGLAYRFENGTRDFMAQVGALAAERPDRQRAMLGWMFSVLEVGHAIIELRHEFETLPPAVAARPDYQLHSPWRTATRAQRVALVALFDDPSRERFAATLAANQAALTRTQEVIAAGLADGWLERAERHRLQRIASYLHFIRTAMLDPHSPLAAFHDGLVPAAP
ncbi:FUSC family protein [Chitinasiproducens palmae]|uniref:Uncharacterized membrane protein YccC n=1 Tax=Chitinasiproducens palmae TaxID=1770053 RepID=A0A1H2PW74_9BURK|nr:FUSC family protein [Chitinasiproducens palmae]SDV51583.1 Uncharacterized membrane protein YccC [Chitinasiproducens palmae]